MLVFRIEQFVHPCTQISGKATGNANQCLFPCRHHCRRGHTLQARPGGHGPVLAALVVEGQDPLVSLVDQVPRDELLQASNRVEALARPDGQRHHKELVGRHRDGYVTVAYGAFCPSS